VPATALLTPSLLVQAGDPRHDRCGADNAKRRRLTLTAAIIMRSGCEDIRPGDRLE
jgi:hypothetical protein